MTDATPSRSPSPGSGLGEPSGDPGPGSGSSRPGSAGETSQGSVRLSGSVAGDAPRASAWRNKRLKKFRLLSILGQGAMGRVFLAEDTTLHRQVAVKVLASAKGGGASERKNAQFIREARAAAALSHPHIVGVLEIGEHKSVIYIAMDLVEGGDVKGLIAAGGPLSVGRACDLAADAAEGLAFAHEMGVIHRDVKPANLMITRRGRVKLADFGLADLGDPNDTHRLRDGVVGTPACMSPEVARGEKATAASDQYGLACTLWHMLTGEPLFSGESFQHVLEKQVRAVPASLVERVPGIPASLAEAIHRALAKNPADRHASCDAFGRILRGHAVAATPGGASHHGSGTVVLPPVAAPGGGAGGVPRAWWLGGAAAGLAAAALVAVGVWAAGSASPPAVAAAPAVVTPDPAPPVPTLPPPAPTTPAEPVPPAAVPPRTPTAPPTATPPPTPPAPTAPGGSPALAAGATARLALAAADGEEVRVAGRLASVGRSPRDNRWSARFAEADADGLTLFWGGDAEPALGSVFGGASGEGLAGRRVEVTGVPTFRFGAPALRIRRAGQVRLGEP